MASFNLMLKRISVLLIIACAVSAGRAQQKAREKTNDDSRGAESAQRQAEDAQRRAQAVDILKNVVESAADIRDTRTRVAVLTGALDLLWKHDEAYTRVNFIKSATALSDRFASDATDRRERSEIRAAMETLLQAFARHDSKAAERLLDKFEKLLEGVLKGNSVSPGERLSVAQASLDSDPMQSTALAARVLETGVPGSFPSYLNELEQRDSAAAAALFGTALSILTSGRVYNPVQVSLLSAYVFRESQLSVPVATGGRNGAPLEFGVFANPLSPPGRDLNQALVRAYLAAAGAYLNAEVNGLGQLVDPDPIHVALCLFLVKKLRGYAAKLGLDSVREWVVLDAKFTIVAERAKLTNQHVNGLAALAQRIVTENNVFQFDGGNAAFTAAETAADPAERQEMLAIGIRQLIDEGKYADANQKLSDIRDEKFRDQLTTYQSFRMAEASLKKHDWNGFNAQVNRLSEARLRTYLFLSAALSASDAGNKEMSSEFLVAAVAAFPKIEEVEARAAALVTTAGILFESADASWGAQVLSEGVKAINRADRYDGAVYGVTLEAPKYKLWLQLPASDLSHSFEQAAKRDWPGSLAAAQGIDSKALRSQAYIAACRNVLKAF